MHLRSSEAHPRASSSQPALLGAANPGISGACGTPSSMCNLGVVPNVWQGGTWPGRLSSSSQEPALLWAPCIPGKTDPGVAPDPLSDSHRVGFPTRRPLELSRVGGRRSEGTEAVPGELPVPPHRGATRWAGSRGGTDTVAPLWFDAAHPRDTKIRLFWCAQV